VKLVTTVAGDVGVVGVAPNGPAAKAGLRAGDTVVSIDGQSVQSVDDVAAALADLKPGATAALVARTASGASRTLHVTLGQYPGS